MSTKTESMFDIAAAMLVLFTAMLDPRISVGLAVIFLVVMSVYKFTRAT